MSSTSSKPALSAHALFDAWPPALRACFDGTHVTAADRLTASLCVADADARCVRTALLSTGELFAPDERTLAFALWPSSRTARAIAGSGRATLTFVFDEAFHQVHLEVRHVPLDDVPLACFVGTIESGETERVPYARLTHGIAFELEEEATVLARWCEQIEWLKRAASTAA
ncbi:hypothetical protein [Caballeronia sp. LZ034LL]|uniref:hypothetical protein n=1 Tax=Caballeronia sp. LZ034LL TaxID=3038567 RepID=UPI0028563ACE|nr:hypothetical protein [Caballeronia sp. LZ034LL]MDR5832961.1 hypothetical protein [Caballeronia sp. LZ034LL]